MAIYTENRDDKRLYIQGRKIKDVIIRVHRDPRKRIDYLTVFTFAILRSVVMLCYLKHKPESKSIWDRIKTKRDEQT
ncbi:hypothetical protein OUZ56_015882 [Daphnia magna]|uniref:Uncharacterized protein n=1 Tax=Daphnia magna TaxID=35525 RepID=A0ABR0AP09_9CRUS|nr:hypothetical protein OUZ56_015882 [Daphnia magna]